MRETNSLGSRRVSARVVTSKSTTRSFYLSLFLSPALSLSLSLSLSFSHTHTHTHTPFFSLSLIRYTSVHGSQRLLSSFHLSRAPLCALVQPLHFDSFRGCDSFANKTRKKRTNGRRRRIRVTKRGKESERKDERQRKKSFKKTRRKVEASGPRSLDSCSRGEPAIKNQLPSENSESLVTKVRFSRERRFQKCNGKLVDASGRTRPVR